MAKQLKVQLLPNWAQMENPDGPVTFIRTNAKESGALQVSLAEYRGGAMPQPTAEKLIELATQVGMSEGANLINTRSGVCIVGTFGTAIFELAEYPRFQVWAQSNGADVVLATHVCVVVPSIDEIREAQEIVEMLAVVEEDK